MQTSIPKIIHKRFKQWALPSKGQGLLFGGARKLKASSKGIPYQHENSVNCVGGFRCCHEAGGGSDATSLCRTRCAGAVVLLWIQFRFIARAAAEPIEFHISTGAADPNPPFLESAKRRNWDLWPALRNHTAKFTHRTTTKYFCAPQSKVLHRTTPYSTKYHAVLQRSTK